MTLWLLNHFSTLTLVLVIVGGTTFFALIVTMLVHRFFPNVANSGFEEITGVLRTDVFALLYTIVLALVIADQSGNLAAASTTASTEANALADLTSASRIFPIEPQIRMNEAINQYVHAVVKDEWPLMQEGKESPRASAALEGLYAMYQSFDPVTPAQEAFYATSAEDLSQVSINRRARLIQSQEGLSPLLRVLLVVGAVLFIVLAFPASVRKLRTKLLIMAPVALFVSFAYLLTILLDYPFAGDLSVDNDAYKGNSLAVFWASDEPRTLRPGDKEVNLGSADLAGIWNSDAFGVTAFREEGGKVRGVYRLGGGTITGSVSEGVFRGWWCEGPTRQPPDDAGEVEWKLVQTSSGELLAGQWRYGTQEAFRGGWDLKEIGGPIPADLAERFDDLAVFCEHP